MNIKKIFALLFVAVAMLVSAAPAMAQQGSADDPITFEIVQADGTVLGTASVPASQALETSLAQFFASVREAIQQVLAAAKGQQTTVTTAISSNVSVRVTGYGTGSSGGGRPSGS